VAVVTAVFTGSTACEIDDDADGTNVSAAAGSVVESEGADDEEGEG
jgi:hypothetical protein